MLDFIGNGSAFNTELGNTSAYKKKGSDLFLIDCGSNVFERMMKMDLLHGVKTIDVLLTHLHPDHVGSLGDLIFYTYWTIEPIMVPKVNIIMDKPFANMIIDASIILNKMGVDSKAYTINVNISEVKKSLKDKYNINGIKGMPVNHDKNLECFGYLIEIGNQTVYYSGDCNEIPEGIVRLFNNGGIQYFYQDTCNADYDGNVHLSLRKLEEYFPYKDKRHKIFCMHLDKGFDKNLACEKGFNVTKTIL